MNKHKFKVGDKVRIAKFPMGMTAGDMANIKRWFDTKVVFTITSLYPYGKYRPGVDNIPTEFAYVSSIEQGRENWYFDLDSICLVKKQKEIKSWSIPCVK